MPEAHSCFFVFDLEALSVVAALKRAMGRATKALQPQATPKRHTTVLDSLARIGAGFYHSQPRKVEFTPRLVNTDRDNNIIRVALLPRDRKRDAEVLVIEDIFT